jgi:hypothetical protein
MAKAKEREGFGAEAHELSISDFEIGVKEKEGYGLPS